MNKWRGRKGADSQRSRYQEDRDYLLGRIERVEQGTIRLNKSIAQINASYAQRIFQLRVALQTERRLGQLAKGVLEGWQRDLELIRQARQDLNHTAAELRSFRSTVRLLRLKVDLVPEGLETLTAGISLLKAEAKDILGKFGEEIPNPEAVPAIDQLQITARELTDELDGFEVAVNKIMESVQG